MFFLIQSVSNNKHYLQSTYISLSQHYRLQGPPNHPNIESLSNISTLFTLPERVSFVNTIDEKFYQKFFHSVRYGTTESNAIWIILN